MEMRYRPYFASDLKREGNRMVRRKSLSNKSRHVSEGRPLADATGYDDACNFLSRNGVDVI